MQARDAAALLQGLIDKGAKLPGLAEQQADDLRAMGRERLEQGMARSLQIPVAYIDQWTFPLQEAYYVAAWVEAFRALGGGAPLRVMEVASGDVAVVPWALELYDGGHSSYATANLNRKLTEGFLGKTGNLRTQVRVIEDDGANMARYYGSGSFDAVAFQHGINDIIQTIVCEREGVDTIHADWWDILPQMTRITDEYHRSGRLEAAARQGFTACLGACAALLRPGGRLIFNNIVYQYDLDLGYPRDLYESFVPLARRWLLEAGMGLTEVTPEGWDRQWWMVLQTPAN